MTAAQYTAIDNGTFEDLFIGDYWTINGVNYRIAHFDYWLRTGDTACTTHHAVIVPDTNITNGQMDAVNYTAKGYAGSGFRSGKNHDSGGNETTDNTALATAKNIIFAAFGEANILSHRELFTTAANGYATNWTWVDSTVDLMSENMVYGHPAWAAYTSAAGLGYETGIDKTQLALFAFNPASIANRAYWWLRDVVSGAYFANVNTGGDANDAYASYTLGIRPAFAIRAA